MDLKAGTRLVSSSDGTEVVVVKAPTVSVDLRCGGNPMVVKGEPLAEAAAVDPMHSDGTQIGKRYADEDCGLEVLCTKGGDGSLSIGDKPLLRKDAKPLPSSD
jgi:hypothetical protein